MIALIEVLAAELRHQVVRAGYWIRPYDGKLDARRWRWQPSGCSVDRAIVARLTPTQLDQIAAAVRRLEDQRGQDGGGPR